MPISRAETVQLTCPQCGHEFESQVWRLVDGAERPDLARRAREGTLHAVSCPQCGHKGVVAGHLLYHDGEQGRLLLAVPAETTAEEDEEAGRRLLGELLAALPPARRAAEYLDVGRIQHLPGPQGLALALRLLEGLQGLLREARRVTQDPLLQALWDFIRAESWPASREVVEAHPELLDERADALLGEWIEAQEDEDVVRVLEEHRALLRRCRDIGVDAAFAEMIQSVQSASPSVDSPLYRLAQQVVAGELTLEQALAQATSETLLAELDEESMRDAGALAEAIADQAPPLAYTLVLLAEAAAGPAGTPYLSGQLAGVRGSMLLRLGQAEAAVAAFTSSLQALRAAGDRRAEGAALGNLGNAYRDLGQVETAIEYYQQALEISREIKDRRGEGSALGNLGLAYRALGQVETAIEYYQQARDAYLRDIPPDAIHLAPFPDERRKVGIGLGGVHYGRGEWLKAHQAYAEAITALGQVWGGAGRQEHKVKLGEENAHLYARAVRCGLHLAAGDRNAARRYHAEAFRYAEMAKARAFLDLLGSQRPDPASLSPELADRLTHALALRKQIDRLLLESPATPSTSPGEQRLARSREVLEKVRELERQEAEAWAAIRRDFPQYYATVQVESMSLEEAQALVAATSDDTAFVGYFQAAEGWVAFVVTPQELTIVPLEVPEGAWDRWYFTFMRCLLRPGGPYPTAVVPLREMYQALFAPLRPLLSGVRRLVISPQGPLHLFPIHAWEYRSSPSQGEVGRGWRALLDDYIIAVVPSASVWRICKEQRQMVGRESFLGVAYPGSGEERLRFVVPEVQAIAARFPRRHGLLLEDQAIKDAVRHHALRFDLVHFACHGLFRLEEPQQSGLWLADGVLTVLEILNTLRLNASLAVLSACGSGMARLGGGDELVSLVRSVMYAGTPAVVASLWPVNDLVTALLFERFYAAFTAGASVAQALREAQLWVRDELTLNGRRFDHPYFWAAFEALGAVL